MTRRLLQATLAIALLGAAPMLAAQPADPWVTADAAGALPRPAFAPRRAITAPPPATPRPSLGRVETTKATAVHPVLRMLERPAGTSIRSWRQAQPRAQVVSTGTVYVHAVWYEYNSWGHLIAVRDWETDAAYWYVNAANVRGQVTSETLGNGVVTGRVYDEVTGALLGVSSGIGNANVQSMTFEWDLAGNLTQRIDHIAGHQEDFAYDDLYRLKETSFTPLTTGAGSALVTAVSYGRLGQITQRGDTGSYAYGVPGNPYAVRSLTNRPGSAADSHFWYDENGNATFQRAGPLTTDAEQRSFIFGAGNRLIQATAMATSTTVGFNYGPTGARYQQHKVKGADTETTVYVGALYERLTATIGGTTTISHRLYVRVGERVIAEEVITNTTRETRYWHRDHLNSVTAITTQDYNGGAFGVVGTQGFFGVYGFATWGDARNAITTASLPSNWQLMALPSGVYHRGFTGHEMLPDLGLIHMNGRVYLPETGNFLSPDPFVQFPESTQGYNRYTYVGNNPLSYTDPSGHFLLSSLLSTLVAEAGGNAIAQAIASMIGGFLESGGDTRAMWQAGLQSLFGSRSGMGNAVGGGRFGDGALGMGVPDCFGNAPSAALSRLAMEAFGRNSALLLASEPLLAALPFEYAVHGAMSLAQLAGHHYVNLKIRMEVRRFARDKLGMSSTEFNLTMFAISMTGEIGESRIRAENGDIVILGIFARGTWRIPADIADVILSVQGLPNATSTRYMLDSGLRGREIRTSHSLGASDAANLLGWGMSPRAELNALPFGRIAPPNSALRMNPLDFVSGGPFGIATQLLFGHQVESVTGTGGLIGQHSLCDSYQRRGPWCN